MLVGWRNGEDIVWMGNKDWGRDERWRQFVWVDRYDTGLVVGFLVHLEVVALRYPFLGVIAEVVQSLSTLQEGKDVAAVEAVRLGMAAVARNRFLKVNVFHSTVVAVEESVPSQV